MPCGGFQAAGIHARRARPGPLRLFGDYASLSSAPRVSTWCKPSCVPAAATASFVRRPLRRRLARFARENRDTAEHAQPSTKRKGAVPGDSPLCVCVTRSLPRVQASGRNDPRDAYE
jgi:hypothetical protein